MTGPTTGPTGDPGAGAGASAARADPTDPAGPPGDTVGPVCPVPLSAGERVLLGHGSGGRLTHDLIRSLFVPAFDTPELAVLGDAAVVDPPTGLGSGDRLAVTTDAFVVQPRFFPGSDIGALAVHGTVNDLAMVGARPLLLSVALILEEGLPLDELHTMTSSMAAAARDAGVRIVTGDTKVVERGSADGIFVVTTGVGTVPAGRDLDPRSSRPGDVVLVSAPVGAHGVAVLSRRAGLAFDTDVVSDTAPLHGLVEAMLAAGPVRCLRDATRGGVATTLNELAEAASVGITVDEGAVPVDPPVRSACEVLGLDPLYVANEGVCLAIVPPGSVEPVLAALHAHPLGGRAAVIGEVTAPDAAGPAAVVGPVRLRTRLGTTRPLLMLTGDQLPRIC